MEKKKYNLHWIYKKTKGSRLSLSIYTLLVLFLPVIQLSFAYFMKLFIDIATGSMDMPLLNIGFYSIALIAVGGLIMIINSALTKYIYGKIECNLRTELMSIVFSRRMIDIGKQHTGELLTKLTADVQAVSICFTTLIDNMVGGAVQTLLATTALFFLNWKIAIILLILTPLLMLLTGALTPTIRKASATDKGNDETNRSMLQENLSRIMLIKMYFMQEKTIKKIKSTYEIKLKSGMKLGLLEGLTLFIGVLFGNVMSLVTLGLGAYFVLKGETTIGSLIMIVQLLNYIVTPITKFSTAIAQIGQAVASAERIGKIYELPAEREIPAALPVNASELIVRNLSFSYASETQVNGEINNNSRGNLLDSVNMSFSKGEVTGITGTSGSGKSTLLKLLIGLYPPQMGTIELKHATGVQRGEEIMSQTAYVPPENCLFTGDVTDNIIMSEHESRYNAMQAAAANANILEFIQSLPHGFDTLLGESGGTVSSGQAQRIAIARAIYKKSQIIVFDEPTANLDAASIEKFQLTIKALAKDAICIIVTHDESTITACDKIYVLENGGISEKDMRYNGDTRD